MIVARSVFIIMPISIILTFLWAPRAALLGETGRILYYHVPFAWIAVLAFIISGFLSVINIFDSKKRYSFLDEKSSNSASIGFLFSILTVVTGSIWAKSAWGSYWNWDPRETSALVLLLIYTAYFSLRSSLSDNAAREKICSSYLIFAMATVPFFVFIIPRMYPSLHPDPIINAQKKILLDERMKITLFFCVVSFTMLYFYLYNILNRISLCIRKTEKI